MAMIIIADDDDIVTDLVSEAFRKYGHGIGAVNNGADALKAILAKSPDLVILDCNMPELSGVNTLTEIRKHPKFYDTPVIMLTGSRGEADRNIAMYSGANAYITKPFDPDFLVFKVEEIIEQNRKGK